jgi:Response regulator containing CheY-like receiver, AAA-type ATPase, and DNA-binding domains
VRLDRLKVLIVDDNENARTLLAQMLRALGSLQIVEACDGSAGLTALEAGDVDIVLTDLVMTPMDGLSFVRALRKSAQRRTATVPVIMVSGHSTLKAISQARDAGVNEFLAKPLSASGLIERLHRTLEHERLFVRTPTYLGPDRRRRADPRRQGPWRRSSDRNNAWAVEI